MGRGREREREREREMSLQMEFLTCRSPVASPKSDPDYLVFITKLFFLFYIPLRPI
jgi:hypothetical protein